MDFRIEETEAKTVVGLTHHGPYHMIGQTFDRLGQARVSAYTPGDVFFASYLDDPSTTTPDQLRSFAGFEGDPAEEPGLESMEMPAGRWAVTVHIGPYSGLGHSWMQAYQSLAEQGREPGSVPCWEVYIDDCEVVPHEAMRTELWLPIK
jgi:AraC family transcriptional regulator